MNLAHHLQRIARLDPQRPAVLLGSRCLHDYAGLARRAGALAGALRTRLGLQAGDRVALLLRNCPQYLEILYGAWMAGLVVVPVNFKLHAREVEYILQDSAPRVLFSSADLAADLRPEATGVSSPLTLLDVHSPDYERLLQAEPWALHACAPQDLAWLFYTSGTTGRPKGVMLTHRNLMAMALAYFTDVDPITPRDAALYAAPMSHGAGLYSIPHVLAGARHVVPESAGFDAQEILDLAPVLKGVSMFAAPTMVNRLVEAAIQRDSHGAGIKTVVYGGGPMYAADIEAAIRQMGQRFVQIYGQGECPMGITALSRMQLADVTHARHAERLASVGLAQSNVEVCVASPDGRPLPPGETGEVLVRGDTVMTGYWRNPEASGHTLRDGWLWTGDLGAFDADGFLTLKDRSKDMIISGGTNIYPREVEEVLLRHPAVREVAVIGRSDPEWGEAVVAYLVPQPGQTLDPAELDALCLENIARFKRPRHYQLLDELPKNNYGKVLKTALRTLDAPSTTKET